jgi:hypothetical protein
MKRIVIRLAALALVVCVILILMVAPGFLAAPITVLVGWWPAIARLYTAWRPNRSALLLFLSAVLALIAGVHWFSMWVYGFVWNPKNDRGRHKWAWKWTLCGFGMLFFTLLAIGSLILTTHQLYWLSKSSDPLFTDPYLGKAGMLNVAMNLQVRAEEAQWNAQKTREAFWRGKAAFTGRPALESIQPVWVEKDRDQLCAIILIPRRPLRRAMAGIVVIQPGTNFVTRSLDELPQVLGSFGIGNVAGGSYGKPPLLP